MSKLSIRFSIVILTFIIGVFAVAGWFYYQESQKIQIIIPNARQDSILFEAVNNATNLSKLPELRKSFVKNGDIEIRIWRGYSLSQFEGVILKRLDGQWSGLHLRTNKYSEPAGVKTEKLNTPEYGWELFWKQLTDKEILTLPQSFENECNIPDIDGMGYVVEINRDRTYRYYFYPQENGKKCREAGQMKDIGEIIGLEFDSGQEKCKTTEWFPCMTLNKPRCLLKNH